MKASYLLLFVLILSIAASARTGTNGAAASWIHEVNGIVRVDERGFPPFKIKAVDAGDNHVVASAIYRKKTGRPFEVIKVEGTQTEDGRFWPRATAQVANDIDGEWKTVGPAPTSGEPATATLKFYEANVMLYVNLDIFRPLVDTMRYGMVSLANGEAAVFELKQLLPSGDKIAAGSTDTDVWQRETVFGYLEDPLARPPFGIVAISSENGQLRGEGGYSDPEGSAPTLIEGTETANGNFWPYGTLQVANDPNGVWKTIGQSINPGNPVTAAFPPKEAERTIYVDLDPFRPMIGKFGYGRVVLRNGKSAAFELAYLLPPNGDWRLISRDDN